MEKSFLAKKAWIEDQFLSNIVVTVKDGVVYSVQPLQDSDIRRDELEFLDGILLPGLVNGHSHAFQVLLRGVADHPLNFRDWVDSFLYPLVLKLDEKMLYQASYTAFRQMIRNGITCVGEFHYIHNLKGEMEEPAEIVIKAAEDAGIRIRLLYTGYDLGKKEGQKRFHRSVDQVINSLNTLRDKYSEHAKVHIGAAPHSLHGASKEMIQNLVQWAEKNEEIVHIHLAEQKSDIKEAIENFGCKPAEVLDTWNVLSPYLAVVHGIWLDEKEIEILARNGVKHVYNPLTNMYLADGIANLPEYFKRGIPTSIGTDANGSLNLLKEVRAAEWLQRIKRLEMGILKRYSSQLIGKALFNMVTKHGGLALNLPIGSIREGNYADFILIDDREISLIPNNSILNQLTSSYSIQYGLKAVWVGGNLVYESLNSKRFSSSKKES